MYTEQKKPSQYKEVSWLFAMCYAFCEIDKYTETMKIRHRVLGYVVQENIAFGTQFFKNINIVFDHGAEMGRVFPKTDERNSFFKLSDKGVEYCKKILGEDTFCSIQKFEI